MIICRYQWCISGHLFFDLRLCVFVCSGRFPPLWKCVIAVRADTVTSYYVGNVCVLSHCLWTLSTALNTPIVYCSFLYFCCCDPVLRLVRYISLDIINFCNSSLDFMVSLFSLASRTVGEISQNLWGLWDQTIIENHCQNRSPPFYTLSKYNELFVVWLGGWFA